MSKPVRFIASHDTMYVINVFPNSRRDGSFCISGRDIMLILEPYQGIEATREAVNSTMVQTCDYVQSVFDQRFISTLDFRKTQVAGIPTFLLSRVRAVYQDDPPDTVDVADLVPVHDPLAGLIDVTPLTEDELQALITPEDLQPKAAVVVPVASNARARTRSSNKAHAVKSSKQIKFEVMSGSRVLSPQDQGKRKANQLKAQQAATQKLRDEHPEIAAALKKAKK